MDAYTLSCCTWKLTKMYKGFDIQLKLVPVFINRFQKHNKTPEFNTTSSEFDMYVNEGRKTYKNSSNTIKSGIDTYLRHNGVIDGAKVSADWFPEIDAHVFLSHSHADEDMVIALAHWLKINFGIKCFIDSCVWGYADELLKGIDDKYCYQPVSETYNYQRRNRTTAFVHNLLCAALTKMMDKCECLMFVNTPNSIYEDPDKNETSSPWIFYELYQSSIIETKLRRERMFSHGGIIEGKHSIAF